MIDNLHTRTCGGFTLVETFVALTILLVAIVAPLTIAQRGLQSSFFAHERVMATYLAEEGVEVIRAFRDAEMIQDEADWLAALPTECLSTNSDGCDYDFVSDDFIDCGSGIDTCVLRYDGDAPSTTVGAKYMYHHDGSKGTPSMFTRQIWVEEIEAEVQAEVRVVVTWTSGLFSSGPRTVEITDRLFNYDSSTAAGSSAGQPVGGGEITDINLVQQLSSTACVENSNWSFDTDSVWTDAGCRAVFQDNLGSCYLCESQGFAYQDCPYTTSGTSCP